MTPTIGSDDLVRYVDGEMDADEARAVEAAAAADPSLRNTIRSLSEGAALLRAAFNEPVHATAADELSTRIAARTAGTTPATIPLRPA